MTFPTSFCPSTGPIGTAIETTKAALERLSPETRLYLQGRHNLAPIPGRGGAARSGGGVGGHRRGPLSPVSGAVDAAPPLLAAGEDRPRSGDTGTTERLFLEARDGFVRQGIGYDAAMVSLDLTETYLKEGRRTSGASPGRWWRSLRRKTSIASVGMAKDRWPPEWIPDQRRTTSQEVEKRGSVCVCRPPLI